MKLSKSQKKELDRRLRDYQKGKGRTYTWEEIVEITNEAMKARLEMIQLSEVDIKAGRLITQAKVDKDDLDWLKST